MMKIQPPSVSRRRSLLIWALFGVIAGVVFLTYSFASLAAGRGEWLMPLDDVYIHFQYARQMAAGQPYIYNPGLPATSGATSFLYPYVLAIGHLIGFQGLNLGLWAMLMGMVALVISTWLVYRLILQLDAPKWLAVTVAMVFELSGPVSWHFMSGMETGLMVLFTLATLYFVVESIHDGDRQDSVRGTVLPATLLALIRPEGGILAALAMGALWFIRRKSGIRANLPLIIPLLAIGVQPIINLVFTGSAVASGNAAKSIFGIVPFYWSEVIRRILENWMRMWAEFLTGISPREGLYIAPLMLVVAVIGLIRLFPNRWRRILGLMLIGWLVFGTLAISTLDTAFWHFKRYQMPFIALMFPLAGWGIAGMLNFTSLSSPYPLKMGKRVFTYLLVSAVSIVSLWTGAQFLHHYALNVNYVYLQPLQMAKWLGANTPPDSVVVVHDTGMMRYMGGRTTIDMVGLTTPRAADYWRNGPGAVAEFLMQQRPDYIASYGHGHGFGLGMLADTDLYGEPLASFPVQLDPNYNVALAADFQGIYKPEWKFPSVFAYHDRNLQPSVLQSLYGDFDEVDRVDVANGISENNHAYRWLNLALTNGFPSEVHELSYIDCAFFDLCIVIDGGRLISSEERFQVKAWRPFVGSDVILVTRVHPVTSGTIDVYANGNWVATRWIPEIPGRWLEIPTLIPSTYLSGEGVSIRIIPDMTSGFYMPYYHWLYQGNYVAALDLNNRITTFQDGAIVLASAQMEYEAESAELPIQIEWYTDGNAQGDYKVFVHVLDKNDQIVAQADTYPGNGTLPPGNWLPGILRDTIMVDLGETPPGEYRVAIGLYNPYTFERLQPEGGDEYGRFFIGNVEIE